VSLRQNGFPIEANSMGDRKESGSARGTSNRSSGSTSSGGSSGYRAAGGSGGSGAGGSSGGSSSSGGSGGSGGGWSAGTGGSGASSGDVGSANLVIDLRVDGPRNSPNQILCTVFGKAQAKDDLGNAIEAPDMPAHLRMELSGIDYPQDSGCAAVHLNVENGEPKSIKSLSGDLLVMDARIQTASFEGKDLDKVSTRMLNGVMVRLNKVQTTEKGINVEAGVSMPNPFVDKLNFHNMQNRLRVVLEDSEGKTHTARSSSGGGGGGGSGGGSSSGGRFSSGGGGGSSHSGGPGDRLPLASYNLQFAPLPEGVAIKKITCTVTELLSGPQRVAFGFNDLPLP
jgi:hypothetical protein